MKVAMLGTRGIPARYGGFETAVEEIGAGLADLGHEVLVYCRSTEHVSTRYRGMHRVVLPSVHRKAWETITHSGMSTVHAVRQRPDVAVVFNAANAPYVAMLRAAGVPTALHIDGHDARREKWQGTGARYYSLATRWGASVASRVIVDSQAIADELQLSHRVGTTFIPYGAMQSADDDAAIAGQIATLGLQPRGYHLVVARFEPENLVLEIIRGYLASTASQPLVVVGFEGYPGGYARRIETTATRDDRVRLIGAVWDQRLLDALYAGATSYLHGHTVGGTNPSLLRAMANEAPVIAYDCPYNRETTADAAAWFRTEREITDLIETVERAPDRLFPAVEKARKRAARHYVWEDVVQAYDRLLVAMAGSSQVTTTQAIEQV
jgi:glycosyltransferase involved in cell wall biosynthesis